MKLVLHATRRSESFAKVSPPLCFCPALYPLRSGGCKNATVKITFFAWSEHSFLYTVKGRPFHPGDPNSLEAGERALFCGRRRRLSSALLNGLHKNTLAEMSRHQSKGRQSDWEEEEQKDPTDQRGEAADFLGGLQHKFVFYPLTFSDISKHRHPHSQKAKKRQSNLKSTSLKNSVDTG